MENGITHVSLSNSNHCDFKLSVKLCSVLRAKVIFAAKLPVMTGVFAFDCQCRFVIFTAHVHVKEQRQEQV